MCPVIASKGLREYESDVENCQLSNFWSTNFLRFPHNIYDKHETHQRQNSLQEPKFYRNSLRFGSDTSANRENNFVRIERCPTNVEKKASKSSWFEFFTKKTDGWIFLKKMFSGGSRIFQSGEGCQPQRLRCRPIIMDKSAMADLGLLGSRGTKYFSIS